MYEWEEKNELAKLYESEFASLYNEQNEDKHLQWNQEPFQADYTLDDSTLCEIKIDFTKWSNFFIERFSNWQTKREGGPWQAKHYKAKYFLYWFVSGKSSNQWKCYVFETDKLLDWLNSNIDKYEGRRKEVQNKGYTTIGYSVPIRDLKPLGLFTVKSLEPSQKRKEELRDEERKIRKK